MPYNIEIHYQERLAYMSNVTSEPGFKMFTI